MKNLSRNISLLLALMLVGLSTPTVAQDRMVFKSLVDLDKCAANNRYDTGYCLEALQKYAKTHPKELFAIGKRARLQFNHWVALQFFEPALGAAPAAVKCADEDVSLAIISGLSQPAENAPTQIASRLLSGACFPSVRAAVEKEIVSENGAGYLFQNACPIFAKKGIKIATCKPKKEISAVPVIKEKLAVINISTAKVGIIKVYSGSEGERVTMADIPGTAGAYLVRIDGVRSPINGKTMVHKEQSSGNGFDYWTEIDGKRWNTIIVRGSSYKNYTVYFPGTRNEIGMSYNEAESKTASAASFKK